MLTMRYAAGRSLLAGAGAGALLGTTAERGRLDCREPVRCEGAPGHRLETNDSSVGTLLTSATVGVGLSVEAAAPALCAVHCTAVSFIVMALPSLQLGGGVCMHRLGFCMVGKKQKSGLCPPLSTTFGGQPY